MAGRPDIRANVSISNRFIPRGYRGVFVKFDIGKVVKVSYCWVVGFELTTQKLMFGTTPFIEELEGVSPFDY